MPTVKFTQALLIVYLSWEMFQDVTECHNISGANSECHPITLTYLIPMPNNSIPPENVRKSLVFYVVNCLPLENLIVSNA